MNKSTSADDVKLMSSYESLRGTLLSDKFRDRLDRQLAFWALPSDRRLPTAFLHRTLDDLLSCSYKELASTAGIGHKKLQTFVKLLVRATKEDASNTTLDEIHAAEEETPLAGLDSDGQFDPALVSEMVWIQWRETARRHGIGHELLGRLTGTLQSLPSVVWNTPLSSYLDLSLAEMRDLKTHGEKRIGVVLEVFHNIHKMLGQADPAGGLAVRLAPRTIASAEDWIAEVRSRSFPPGHEEIGQYLIEPILQQLAIDAGDTVAKLARGRLGVGAGTESVRHQSQSLGVTRARVYQMLEECHGVMQIRWPEGRRQLDDFGQWLDECYASAEAANLVASFRELLYPLKFDSVGEALRAEAV
ncbi:MAG TPA: hypothetical protein VFV87_05155 [Pirellulaceae bacterium]|nr:hypothetical protein [Pirellulaceae bacterium]